MKNKKTFGTVAIIMGWLCLFASVLSFARTDEKSEIIEHDLDYKDPKNWAFYENNSDKVADVFLVCPTVDLGSKGNYLMDVSDEEMRSGFVGALNMERGIYDVDANIIAPFYRQATLPVYSMKAEEAELYFNKAYSDVRSAFKHYISNSDAHRPFILAGFSQGSDMVMRLMKEFLNVDTLKSRLVATYCIGWKLMQKDIDSYPWLKPAKEEFDTGVIISFNSEAEAIDSSLIVGKGEKTISINPLNWRTDNTPAKAKDNLGACFTNYNGEIVKEEKSLCGAHIKPGRGTLSVTGVSTADYPGVLFQDGVYHLYDYQFFYRNLQKNVRDRIKVAISN